MANEKSDKHENPNDAPRYGEAANKIHSLLWVERQQRETGGFSSSSAMEDVLQAVWSNIVEHTFDMAKDAKANGWAFTPIENSHIDGIMYEVAMDFEDTIASIQAMRHALTGLSFCIISKDLKHYTEAITHLRYNLISKEGRIRFGYLSLGEE